MNKIDLNLSVFKRTCQLLLQPQKPKKSFYSLKTLAILVALIYKHLLINRSGSFLTMLKSISETALSIQPSHLPVMQADKQVIFIGMPFLS